MAVNMKTKKVLTSKVSDNKKNCIPKSTSLSSPSELQYLNPNSSQLDQRMSSIILSVEISE